LYTSQRKAAELHDKDEAIYQALMNAIVEHQLPPGSKLPACAPRLGVRVTICTAARRCSTLRIPVRLTPNTAENEARDIFRTRSLMECANLPAVLAHLQAPHLAALAQLISRVTISVST
jgi:DNA-binding GntR family transcriptional regulator